MYDEYKVNDLYVFVSYWMRNTFIFKNYVCVPTDSPGSFTIQAYFVCREDVNREREKRKS